MLRKIYTKLLFKTVLADNPKWSYEPCADKYIPDADLWIVGVDINAELCAYRNHFMNESAVYAEASKNIGISEKGARDGVLLRVHSVYNQSKVSLIEAYLNRLVPGKRSAYVGNSGVLFEGSRSIMFPEGTGVFLEKGYPIYLHIQTKGFISVGVHCNIFYVLT